MRKLTSIIALLLAFVMLLSFCACKNDPKPNPEGTTAGDEQGTQPTC